MRFVKRSNTGEFSLTAEFVGDSIIPPYAILSHTWREGEEITFKDMIDSTGQDKSGYNKILFCGQQAERDGLQYFWVDTCCIDKSNHVELQEAINSMFRWYQNAVKCYVYLSDVSDISDPTSKVDHTLACAWEPAFRRSRWFTRGWTLQELLAPPSVDFFSHEGSRLGNKKTLELQIHEITGIAISALQGTPLCEFTVDERLSWAKGRQTTRKEDKAYSLSGIFNIFVPLMYGEGEDKALARVLEEIHKASKTSPGTDDPLHQLSIAAEAPFNSSLKQHEPTCLPETRVELLQEIYDWTDGQNKRRIFWLNGFAGTGKSTVARTVARRLSEKGRLGASFFFSKDTENLRHAGKFVTTIAVQLAHNVSALYKHINDAVMGRRDIARQSLRDQWNYLINHPLSMLDANGRHYSYILVVDALDECDDDNSIATIVQLLAETSSFGKGPLRVFLTSRPETAIQCEFSRVPVTQHHNFVLHNIPLSIVDNDIFLFLKFKLRLIGQEHCLDEGWPSAEAITVLVRKAGGLFIWAATACRFIREGLFAEDRLIELVEGGITDASSAPEKHLDRMYTTVLQSAIPPSFTARERAQFYTILREVLGSVAVSLSTFSVESWSKLLCIPKPRIDRILRDLHAIIDVPKDQTCPVRLHHPSFRDFLLDRDRCVDSNFLVDKKQAHRTLAVQCIQKMSTFLRKDICALSTPGVLVADIQRGRVEHCIPPDAQYACVYWIHHLQESGAPLCDQTYDFFKDHFLHWLEALSKDSDRPELHAFVLDMRRFMLYCRPIVEQAPLQVYYSALVFAPVRSKVRNQFQDSMLQYMRRVPEGKQDWDSLLQSFEIDAASVEKQFGVEGIAFSPDGRILASAAENGTVKLWNAGTGSELDNFKDYARSPILAFSPDGKVLGLTSKYTTTVTLRDINRRAKLQTLKGHWDLAEPLAMAFSPDGKALALALNTGTIWVWNTSTGITQNILENSQDLQSVAAVAFSADGKILASAWADQTITLRDTRTGVELQTREGYPGFYERLVVAMAFSSNGKVLALVSGPPVHGNATFSLYDTATGNMLQRGTSGPTRNIALSPNGMVTALVGFSNIELWDNNTRETQKILKVNRWGEAVAFSPEGTVLASGWHDGMVRLWDTSTEAKELLKDHREPVSKVAFSPEGKSLASGWYDGMVRLWDVSTGRTQQIFKSDSGCIRDIAFSPDGKVLAAVLDDDTIVLWGGDKEATPRTLKGRPEMELSFSPDSKVLPLPPVSDSDGAAINLWEIGTGALLQKLEGHPTSPSGLAMAFSLDAKMLASAASLVDGTVKIWNTSTGAELTELKPLMEPSSTVWAMAFSPDGKILALAFDHVASLWDTDTWMPIQTLDHPTEVTAIAFSPDSKVLASAAGIEFISYGVFVEKTVMLWEVNSGAMLQTLKVETGICSLSFSDDGKILKTDKGVLAIAPFHLLERASRQRFAREIFVKDQWVTIGAENVLWIPHEYRTRYTAVCGGVVALRDEHDRMLVLEFK